MSEERTRPAGVPRPEPQLPRADSFDPFRCALGGRSGLNEEFVLIPPPDVFLASEEPPPDQLLKPCRELGGRFAPSEAADFDVFPQFEAELELRPDQAPEFGRPAEVRLAPDPPPRPYPEFAY